MAIDISERNTLLADSGNDLNSPQIVSGGWSRHLVLAASAAVIGSSFQFGYNTGVINAPGAVIQQFMNETFFERYGHYVEPLTLNVLWGVAVSIFSIGGMIGSLSAGYFVNLMGRKRTMLGNNVIAMIAIVFMGCSKVAGSFEMLIIGRLIIGVNCGINTIVAPMYLTEIAPIRLRGILGTSNQLGIVTSLLISQVLGLSQVLGTSGEWPLLLMLCGVFALYQLLVLPLCPETPAYLLSKGLEDDARYSLLYLRGHGHDVDSEIEYMKSGEIHNHQIGKTSISEIFKRQSLRQPMLIAAVMQLAQQLTGINAVFYYSTAIFVSAGVAHDKSDLVTVGMGLANVVMTLVSLSLIDRIGRRILMLTGLGGMCVCSIVLVISLTVGSHTHWGSVIAVVAVMLFVTAFQTGPGSIPWFITAELFPENARASAMSIAGITNWGAGFAVGIAYLPLQNLIDGYTFTIFAVLLAMLWIFTYMKVPETKGKGVDEITRMFSDT